MRKAQLVAQKKVWYENDRKMILGFINEKNVDFRPTNSRNCHYEFHEIKKMEQLDQRQIIVK